MHTVQPHRQVCSRLACAAMLTQTIRTCACTGHQPHGDCPCVMRCGPVTVITADTSYSDMGHDSTWGKDNRGVNAVNEVLLYADGTSEVHGRLKDGENFAYKLGAGGDKFVGRQLSNGFWVKARILGAEPEYLLVRGEGFTLTAQRKKVWEMEGLTDAHFMVQPCHDVGLKDAGIDASFHGLLLSAGLDIETLKMAADDRRYLDSILKEAGIIKPGDRVQIVKRLMAPNL